MVPIDFQRYKQEVNELFHFNASLPGQFVQYDEA